MAEKTQDAPKAPKLIPVRILRDYWANDDVKDQWPTSDDNRIRAGSKINLPGTEARRLIGEGTAERADPLPDEVA
jgi:hypothetical protein